MIFSYSASRGFILAFLFVMSSDGGGASASAEEQLSAAVVQLLQSDLKIVAEDYQLLKRLNDAASQKYGNMSTVVSLGKRTYCSATFSLFFFFCFFLFAP